MKGRDAIEHIVERHLFDKAGRSAIRAALELEAEADAMRAVCALPNRNPPWATWAKDYAKAVAQGSEAAAATGRGMGACVVTTKLHPRDIAERLFPLTAAVEVEEFLLQEWDGWAGKASARYAYCEHCGMFLANPDGACVLHRCQDNVLRGVPVVRAVLTVEIEHWRAELPDSIAKHGSGG